MRDLEQIDRELEAHFATPNEYSHAANLAALITEPPRQVSAEELAERFADSDGASADVADADGGYAFATTEDQIEDSSASKPTPPAAHRFVINVETALPLSQEQKDRLTAAVRAVRLFPKSSKASKVSRRHPSKKLNARCRKKSN